MTKNHYVSQKRNANIKVLSFCYVLSTSTKMITISKDHSLLSRKEMMKGKVTCPRFYLQHQEFIPTVNMEPGHATRPSVHHTYPMLPLTRWQWSSNTGQYDVISLAAYELSCKWTWSYSLYVRELGLTETFPQSNPKVIILRQQDMADRRRQQGKSPQFTLRIQNLAFSQITSILLPFDILEDSSGEGLYSLSKWFKTE